MIHGTPAPTTLLLDSLFPFRTREYLRGLYDRWNLANLMNEGDGYTLSPFVKHQCLFVHIPKAAGISVAQSLFGSLAGGHRSLNRYRVALGKDFVDRAFKFTVVRNPWERLVSAYFFLKAGGLTPEDARWSRMHLTPTGGFDDFVTGWLTRARAEAQQHLVPQTRFLERKRGEIGVDFVARLENLEDDFSKIATSLGIPAQLATLNRSAHEHYRTYYSTRSMRIVADVYREDVELLGYEF